MREGDSLTLTVGPGPSELPETLSRRFGRAGDAAPDAPFGHFHLRRGRGAVIARDERHAAREQLLGPQRRDDHELIRIERCRPDYHRGTGLRLASVHDFSQVRHRHAVDGVKVFANVSTDLA
jgi:hypothetical protein